MLTISSIHSRLLAGKSGNTYTLQKQSTDTIQLREFFDVLGQDKLIVTEGVLSPVTDTTKVILTGDTSNVFGFTTSKVSLKFTKNSNLINTQLTITPPTTEVLQLNAFWLPLTKVVITLRLQGKFNVSSLEVEGNIRHRDSIRLRLSKLAGEEWRVGLVQTDPKSTSLPQFASDLFGFESRVNISSYIPDAITGVLKNINIDALNCIFNPVERSVSFFEAGIASNHEWSLIPSKLTIQKLSLGLLVVNPLSARRQFSGRIGGQINITDAIKAEVIAIGNSDLWTLEILPAVAGGISIPSIPHMFEMAGADIGNLPVAIRSLPGLSLEEFRVAFSPTNLAIEEFATRIKTASPWEIIPDYLSFTEIEVDVNLEKRPQWKFVSGGISTVWKLGNSLEIAFGAQAAESNWTFTGTLLTSVNFTSLFNNKLHLPASFPTITLQQANVVATPSTRTFHLDGVIDIDASHTDALGIPLPATKIGGTLDVSNDGRVTKYEGKVHLEVGIGQTKILVDAKIGNTSGATALDFKGQIKGDVPIGRLIQDIKNTRGFGLSAAIPIPKPIESLTLRNLMVEFNTATKNFTFSGDAVFDVSGNQVDINVIVEVKKTGNTYNVSFRGKLKVANVELDVSFERSSTESILAATYKPKDGTILPSLTLNELVRPLAGDSLSSSLPDLKVSLKNMLLGIDKTAGTSTKFLLKVDTGVAANLNHLPVVGHAFSSDTEFKIDNLGLVITNTNWTTANLTALNNVLPIGTAPLLTTPITKRIDVSTAEVNLDLSSWGLGNTVQGEITSAFNTTNTTAGTNTATNPPATQPSPRPGKWFKVDKTLGPVTIKRVGVLPQGKTIFFVIDGDLALAGLEMEARGLGIGFDLAHNYKPSFHLDGMGIEIKKGSVEIGGAFLHNQLTYQGETVDQYSGGLVVKLPKFAVMALGSYAKVKGQASVFIYAAVDATLATFLDIVSLTGVALGFGYNRRLNVPPLDQVASFPLVADAIGGQNSPNTDTNLLDKLDQMSRYAPISLGDVFFAIGIKVTLAELVDAFAMVTLSFGHHFRVDILGIATMVLPPDTPNPLAEIQLALKASLNPDIGLMSVEGRLTPNSFVISRDCHLTGGFAFYNWFTGLYAGDFVMSIGGYHPSFRVPPHYPRVPRLGFNWNVTSHLNLKGGMYAAMVPHAFMAGGDLNAIFSASHVDAWFRVGAHFLISWKPLHYDIRAYMEVGARVSFLFIHITVHIGANLHVYGPKFGGTARLHLGPIHVTVSFGGNNPGLQPVAWSEFRRSFLPKSAKAFATVNARSGLIKKVTFESNEWWVINPKEFKLTTGSVVPTKERRLVKTIAIDKTKTFTTQTYNGNIGISPMDLPANNLQTIQEITIRRISGTTDEIVTEDFKYSLVRKNVPTGLWGTRLSRDLNGTRLVRNVVTGFEILPRGEVIKGTTQSIAINKLEDNSPDGVLQEFSFETVSDTSTTLTQANIATLAEKDAQRNSLHNYLLGVTAPGISLNTIEQDDFLFN